MTETVQQLIRAAVAGEGHDHTLYGILADALDEAHPAGRDGRATLLRRFATANPDNKTLIGRHAGAAAPAHIENTADGPGMIVGLVNPSFDAPLHYRLQLHDWTPRPGHLSPRYRHLAVPVGVTEAREIANDLPNADEVHDFLDHHFGSEQDHTALDPYSEHYSRALQ